MAVLGNGAGTVGVSQPSGIVGSEVLLQPQYTPPPSRILFLDYVPVTINLSFVATVTTSGILATGRAYARAFLATATTSAALAMNRSYARAFVATVTTSAALKKTLQLGRVATLTTSAAVQKVLRLGRLAQVATSAVWTFIKNPPRNVVRITMGDEPVGRLTMGDEPVGRLTMGDEIYDSE